MAADPGVPVGPGVMPLISRYSGPPVEPFDELLGAIERELFNSGTHGDLTVTRKNRGAIAEAIKRAVLGTPATPTESPSTGGVPGELLPCPFCGGAPERQGDGERHPLLARCYYCGTSWFQVAAWNRRTPSAPPLERSAGEREAGYAEGTADAAAYLRRRAASSREFAASLSPEEAGPPLHRSKVVDDLAYLIERGDHIGAASRGSDGAPQPPQGTAGTGRGTL